MTSWAPSRRPAIGPDRVEKTNSLAATPRFARARAPPRAPRGRRGRPRGAEREAAQLPAVVVTPKERGLGDAQLRGDLLATRGRQGALEEHHDRGAASCPSPMNASTHHIRRPRSSRSPTSTEPAQRAFTSVRPRVRRCRHRSASRRTTCTPASTGGVGAPTSSTSGSTSTPRAVPRGGHGGRGGRSRRRDRRSAPCGTAHTVPLASGYRVTGGTGPRSMAAARDAARRERGAPSSTRSCRSAVLRSGDSAVARGVEQVSGASAS